MAEDQDFLSFKLSNDFVAQYKKKKVNWGFPIGGGNSIGELTFIKNYSRRKPNGKKERWFETCQRVIEGYYSILKDHCKQQRTPWNEARAQHAAKDAYDRLFNFKWTPPGRGLWTMGTEFVNGRNNSAALQNCSFLSTEKLSPRSVYESILPFTRLMEMSMLGVGVGFDTKGADKLTIHKPLADDSFEYVIEDTREAWCESVGHLLESYLFQNRPTVVFDYSLIRPEGEPIKGFGGIAAGPGPLIDLHNSLRRLFDGREGQPLSSVDIVDVENLIGKCVVSGNVRRSAELSLGEADDQAFLDLKNWEINPERMDADGWGHMSNNSVIAQVGGSYDHLIEAIAENGEPGLLYLDLCRAYGRLVDPPNNRDYRVMGTNPCSEQSLESYEMCTLVETFPYHHDNLDDYKTTLKHAYLYAKAVTLMPTHWAETNEIMQRNRRIGCSVSGVVQFAEEHGWTELRTWLDEGYQEVTRRDREYSEWLGVRESIKTTSVKPSGTVSLLAGATPGVHWPVDDIYIRRMRLSANDPIVNLLIEAGYKVEPDLMNPDYDVVVELPTKGPQVRTENEVDVWEKAALAALVQRHWADNQVSVTLTFSEEEKSQIGSLIRAFEGQLKSISMLPIKDGGAYKQMPYERIDMNVYSEMVDKVQTIDWKRIYNGESLDAVGEKFCTTDKCLLPIAEELSVMTVK